jgi:glycosyltransferase involved in cell wall biosynthesis
VSGSGDGSSELVIDVVVPTYDNRVELLACLDALSHQGVEPLRVLVCVDGSTDATIEALAAYDGPLEVEVLEHSDRSNHGRAAARNLALRRLMADNVLFLDSDMELATDGIRRHLEVLGRASTVSIGDVSYRNCRENLWARYLMTRGKHKYPPGSVVGPLEFHGSNVAMRTEDLRAVGGFDPELSEYGGEDTELALRLAGRRGLRFVYNTSARAEATEHKLVDEALGQLRRYGATNLRAIRRKHPGPPAPFWLDRLESRRTRDRLFRLLLNPISDGVARTLLHVPAFAIQRRALDYLVLRSVWRGYLEVRA